MNAPTMMTARGKYRLVRRSPFTVTDARMIRISADCHAEPGDKFFVYESDDGNLMLMKEDDSLQTP